MSKQNINDAISQTRPQTKLRDNAVKYLLFADGVERRGSMAIKNGEVVGERSILVSQIVYKILVNRRNEPFQPNEAYQKTSRQLSRAMGNIEPFRLLKVSKNTYDSFVKYLQTGSVSHWKSALSGV